MSYPLKNTIERLHQLANPDALPAMRHFALSGENRLGISIPKLRLLAKEIGMDHTLALALWDTTIPEAQILATLISDPHRVTSEQMDQWAHTLTSWDICDAACNNLFVSTPFAWKKVYQWAREEPEFTRRAGFVLIACLATHDKQASDSQFINTFQLITSTTTDPRNFVKKAVNWAIRGIGKRNLVLNHATITLCEDIQAIDDPTAHWIAADAKRELTNEKIQQRLLKRTKNN